MVGTITVVMNGTNDPINWFSKPRVSYFTQFAIHKEAQRKGYGDDLLKFVETYAKNGGALESALDTSEKAVEFLRVSI